MLKDLLASLNPTSPVNRLLSIKDLIKLEQSVNEPPSDYMLRARTLQQSLQGVVISDLMPLFVMATLDPEQYGGLLDRFVRGDISLSGLTLDALEQEMKEESERRLLLGSVSDNNNTPSSPSIRRAGRPPTNTPTPPSPAPAPPPAAAASPTYPPSSSPHWASIKKVINDEPMCPHCFFRHDDPSNEKLVFHRTKGCPALASAGRICVHDADKAATVVQEFDDKFPRHKRQGGRGRGGGRGRSGGGRGEHGGRRQGSEDTAQQSGGEPSASRVTTPPGGQQPPSVPAAGSNTIYDAFASDSDSEDVGALDTSFVVDDSHNSNPSSSGYSSASPLTRGSLPERGSSSTNKPSTKWTRRLAARTATASARFLSSQLNEIAAALAKSTHVASMVPHEAECCADSGTTDDMLNDYRAFSSYLPLTGKYAILGDDTRVEIKGIGSAVYSLNGKVVKTRNALHIPSLRGPLLSLRRHRRRQGCGVYSSYDVGSYILFPTFVLEVDDSHDNLLSYKSLGHSYTGHIDYVKPRTPQVDVSTPSGRPSTTIEPTTTPIHLIPSDDDSVQLPPSSDEESPSPPGAPVSPSPTASETPLTDDELAVNTAAPLTSRTLGALHHDPTSLPAVPPAYTAAPCESRTTFDTLAIHKIFGCRRFRNQRHVTDASNANLIHTGELPPTLGSFATIPNPPRGKPIKTRRRFLDKVHMDIVFGDCVALGGYRYAIIFVDVATRYCWLFGLTSLTSSEIISAFELLRSDASGVPRRFHSDFDKKLIGGQALKWILTDNSNIKAAPAKRQSSNGLAESTWKTIVKMARAYITEKQVGREYWYFAIKHAAHMLNQVPGRLRRKLTTPFELVHNVKPDPRTWFELFSVGYFNHDTDNAELRSKTQAQTLDGIAVGRDDRSNTVIFYNPVSRSYYRPPAFRLDEGRHPATNFPKSLKFDGGLTCGLLRYKTDPVPEPFPPGTRVDITHNDAKVKGTIQNIPLPTSPAFVSTRDSSHASSPAQTQDSAQAPSPAQTNDDPPPLYVVALDDGTTIERTYEDLIKDSLPTVSSPSTTPSTPILEGIPSFLRHDSKVTSLGGASSLLSVAMLVPAKLIGPCLSLTSNRIGLHSLVKTFSFQATLRSAPSLNLLPQIRHHR